MRPNRRGPPGSYQLRPPRERRVGRTANPEKRRTHHRYRVAQSTTCRRLDRGYRTRHFRAKVRRGAAPEPERTASRILRPPAFRARRRKRQDRAGDSRRIRLYADNLAMGLGHLRGPRREAWTTARHRTASNED